MTADAAGLMTYRYFGRSVRTLDDPRPLVVRPDMRNAAGGLLVAPLAILAPETGNVTTPDAVTAPVTVSIQVLDSGRDVRALAVRRRPVHAGRTMGFGSAEIVDADHPERLIAVIAGTGVKVGEAPGGAGGEDVDDDPPAAGPDPSSLPSLPDAFGAHRRAPGVWTLPPLDPATASTSASLHLGPIHVAFEAAATDLAAAAAGTDQLQVEDWTVLFVSRGTDGPFVVTGDAVAGASGRVACRLHLRDEGRGDRVVAWASGVLRAVS